MPASAAARVPRGKVATGSRARLEIKGKPVGYATIAAFDEAIGYVPIEVLDQLEIAEHAAVSYDVSLRFGTVVVVKESLKKAGLWPKWPSGESSETLLRNIIALGELTAAIVDQIEGTVHRITGVRLATRSLGYGARAIVGEDVAAVAIRLADADELN